MSETQIALTGRDHGGGLDAAIAKWGGNRSDWLDLSTGINRNPYPFSPPPSYAWTDLPDQSAARRTETAARDFWNVPKSADLLLTPGLSVVIAQLPFVLAGTSFTISEPTYNEYNASFFDAGWQKSSDAPVGIFISPNNPTGDWTTAEAASQYKMCIIDESFADTEPTGSLANLATQPGTLILKGLGKFWGLAGLRFGAVFGDPNLIGALRNRLGPWPVSGPALNIASQALADHYWAAATRKELDKNANRLDQIIQTLGGSLTGGTSLFRLYSVDDAAKFHETFAAHFILTRVFPYSPTLIRFGTPATEAEFERLEQIKKTAGGE